MTFGSTVFAVMIGIFLTALSIVCLEESYEWFKRKKRAYDSAAMERRAKNIKINQDLALKDSLYAKALGLIDAEKRTSAFRAINEGKDLSTIATYLDKLLIQQLNQPTTEEGDTKDV